MKPRSPDDSAPARRLILSTEGFTPRPALDVHTEKKAGKLLRHLHPRVALVRVHVKLEPSHAGTACFAVCATVEKTGIDHVAHATSTEPELAINAAVAKLERVVSAAAGMRKQRRHRPAASAPRRPRA